MKAIAISLALVGIVALAPAQSLRSQINAMEKVVTTAMKKKDTTAFATIMKSESTADFKYKEGNQTQNMDQMVTHMKMGIGMMKKITEASGTILSIKETGNKASVLMKRTMTGVVPGPDKKDHVLAFSGVCTDTYVKVGGKWKLASMTWGKQTNTMDGKPVDMSKM